MIKYVYPDASICYIHFQTILQTIFANSRQTNQLLVKSTHGITFLVLITWNRLWVGSKHPKKLCLTGLEGLQNSILIHFFFMNKPLTSEICCVFVESQPTFLLHRFEHFVGYIWSKPVWLEKNVPKISLAKYVGGLKYYHCMRDVVVILKFQSQITCRG